MGCNRRRQALPDAHYAEPRHANSPYADYRRPQLASGVEEVKGEHETFFRRQTWSLRDHRSDSQGRHGRGVPRSKITMMPDFFGGWHDSARMVSHSEACFFQRTLPLIGPKTAFKTLLL